MPSFDGENIIGGVNQITEVDDVLEVSIRKGLRIDGIETNVLKRMGRGISKQVRYDTVSANVCIPLGSEKRKKKKRNEGKIPGGCSRRVELEAGCCLSQKLLSCA